MATEPIEVQRVIAVTPPEVFTLLCDPEGHLAIDSSGMLLGILARTLGPMPAAQRY